MAVRPVRAPLPSRSDMEGGAAALFLAWIPTVLGNSENPTSLQRPEFSVQYFKPLSLEVIKIWLIHSGKRLG